MKFKKKKKKIKPWDQEQEHSSRSKKKHRKKHPPRSKVVSIPVQFVRSGRGVVRLVGIEDPEGVPRSSGEEEREEDRGDQERSQWGGKADLEGGGVGINERSLWIHNQPKTKTPIFFEPQSHSQTSISKH